jgi:hypothetical protein
MAHVHGDSRGGDRQLVSGIELDLVIPIEDDELPSPMVVNLLKKLEIPNLSVYATEPRRILLRMNTGDVHVIRAAIDRLLELAPGVFLKTADVYGSRGHPGDEALMKLPACGEEMEHKKRWSTK